MPPARAGARASGRRSAPARSSWPRSTSTPTRSVARTFRIQSIPAVKAFRDGEVAAEFVGAQPPAAVDRFLDSLLPSEADALVAKGDEQSLRRAVELEPRRADAAVPLARMLHRPRRAATRRCALVQEMPGQLRRRRPRRPDRARALARPTDLRASRRRSPRSTPATRARARSAARGASQRRRRAGTTSAASSSGSSTSSASRIRSRASRAAGSPPRSTEPVFTPPASAAPLGSRRWAAIPPPGRPAAGPAVAGRTAAAGPARPAPRGRPS